MIDESVLDIGEVTCPNCGDRFSMDLVEEPEADDGADDPQYRRVTIDKAKPRTEWVRGFSAAFSRGRTPARS